MSVKSILKKIPDRPGVYIFKDKNGRDLYIGKAASLKKRVSSYFQKGHDTKTGALVKNIEDLEFVVTKSEHEALILESNLVKMRNPRYNVRLKDDKKWLYVKVTDSELPRVHLTREVGDDGRYYGPFSKAGALRRGLKSLRRVFPVCTCKAKPGGRPCIDSQIKLCSAPLAGRIKKDEYRQIVLDFELFMKGKTPELLADLNKRMARAARSKQYEKAAGLRDRISAIRGIVEGQKTAIPRRFHQDVVGVAMAGDKASFEILFIREGKIRDRDSFFIKSRFLDEESILSGFLKQYYHKGARIPKEIIIPLKIEEKAGLENWLSNRAGHRVSITVPRSGRKAELLRMANKNAGLALGMKVGVDVGVAALKDALSLKTLPTTIEAVDVSNIGGKKATGSLIVFRDGKASRKDYRRFRLTTPGPDDTAMIGEVVTRRIERLKKEKKQLPDLLLIDGGIGQVNAAAKALGDAKVPVIGLAKENEDIYFPFNSKPLKLKKDSPALRLLQRARDEAHRFAVSYHRKLRAKDAKRSALDDVSGVGKMRKKALLRRFGSVEGIRRAGVDEVAGVEGISRGLAERILIHLD
jgi:excinuclease ABC subunit C